MLQTLLKIGELQLKGKGIWSQLVKTPKFNPKKRNWVCTILFDCVNNEIKVLANEMELFTPGESPLMHRYLNPALWGPRGKKCALTVETKNFSMLTETLFGKDESDSSGTFIQAITNLSTDFEETAFYQALLEIYARLSDQRQSLEIAEIKKKISLSQEEDIVMYVACIQSQNPEIGKRFLHQLEGYEEFVIQKFQQTEQTDLGIDLVTSNESQHIKAAEFTGRYNLNKIFQTTTVNFASNFHDFKKNFQISEGSLAKLDKASEFLLSSADLNTRIAGISHLIIPSLLNRDLENFDTELISEAISATNEFLFRMQQTDTGIQKNLSQLPLFWVNYIGYESDGNSFKIISQINDVNSFYLAKLIEVFGDTSYELSDLLDNQGGFNLQSIYRIIPIRDGQKAKVNPVLSLFKDIFEQRPIDPNLLFEHFKNLLLCHRFTRYRAFSNIRENNSFDYAIKDAVFKYAAMFYALKHLNLIPMDTTQPTETAPLPEESSFQEHTEHLFARMQYTDAEKALFYLGRVLSSVAYAQYKKGHESKPVLNKLNFNGMDEQAMMRFSLDLAEKARQYNLHRETDFNFARFRALFNEKSWPLTKEQNLFYLLAGYTFHLTLPSKQS